MLGLRLTVEKATSYNLEWDEIEHWKPEASELDALVATSGRGLLSILEGDGPLVPPLTLEPSVPKPTGSPPKRRKSDSSPAGCSKVCAKTASSDSEDDPESDSSGSQGRATPSAHPLVCGESATPAVPCHALRILHARHVCGMSCTCV